MELLGLDRALVDALELLANIPVTLAPDGATGLDLFHTLQVPIQTPVSPDERWVATAVLSLTTVPRANTGSADHVAIIDTRTNSVVAYIPTPAGTHGVNWGAKLGGGYYAYVTNQHANVLSVIDLRLLFDIPIQDDEMQSRPFNLVVIKAAGLEISLAAHEVYGVIDLSSSDLSLPSEALVGIDPDYIAGATADGLILLDTEMLLADKRLIVEEEII